MREFESPARCLRADIGRKDRMKFAAIASLATLAATVFGVEPKALPNLTGEWVLNRELSDAPRGAGDPSAGHARRGGEEGGMSGRSGRGRGGMGGGTGAGRGAADPEQMQRLRESMTEMMQPAARVTVTQADGTITFTTADGRSQTFATDGRKEKHQVGAQTAETKTQWKGEHLTKEVSFAGGLKVTETYALVPEPAQLEVVVKIDGPMGRTISQKRVYERSASP
jgi:hypothetical protein